MPVPKKGTTPVSQTAKVESFDQNMPTEQDFRQYMRNLAVGAMRVLIEEVMREELEQCLGAAWGECTPSRTGYRNGSYTRDLVTKTGRIEDLCVPRDREGVFHSQAFERYSRYEPEVAEAQALFFVATTPLSEQGHVNLSPKGYDTFCILSSNQVAYLDLIGSGNETSAHLAENGRITFLFCAFGGIPQILCL